MDEKDERILTILLRDGRKPVVEIANELGIPRATVQERLRRMLANGIIKRFAAIPNYQKIGKEVLAYVLVSFRSEEGISQRELAEEISKMSEVYEVSLISGEWDILLKVRAHSVEDVGSLVIDKLRRMKGIEKTQTCVCFQVLKENL